MPSVEEGFDLLIYTEAPFPGGAEMVLAHVMGALPHQIRVSILGVDAECGQRVAHVPAIVVPAPGASRNQDVASPGSPGLMTMPT